MKTILFIFLLAITSPSISNAINNVPLSVGTKHVVIKRNLNRHHHYYEPIELPEVIYYEYDSTITVDFGNQPVNDYVVTISTPLIDFDYYATSPFTIIPLAVDGISDYSITIETADGDMFEGTLYASEYTSNATF